VSLEQYARNGWIVAEPTSGDEIQRLLSIVDRGIADAKIEAISPDLRMVAAFSAALTAATIALRASGYRTKTQVGHHLKTIECMEFTLGVDSKLLNKMRALSKKRNAASYDAAGNVSEQELKLAISVATELRTDVTVWLTNHHPQLVPKS
jgi:hypothetical protein